MVKRPAGTSLAPPAGWPDQFQSDRAVAFSSPIIQATAGWWVQSFVIGGSPVFPREMAERLAAGLPGRPKCLFTLVAPGLGRVSVEVQGVDDSAHQIWFSGQSIEFVPIRRVFSDLVMVANDRQGTGIARTIMANCYGLGRDLGLDELGLRASWVGAYSWLRFGFVPQGDDWQGPLKAHLVGRLLAVKNSIPQTAFNSALRILGSEEPKAAWILADDCTPIVIAGTERRFMTLGQALFADCGATWYGRVSFSDAEAVERFEDYVGW